MVEAELLIDFSSMSDGDDGNDETAVMDLVDDAIIADANAPGVAFFLTFLQPGGRGACSSSIILSSIRVAMALGGLFSCFVRKAG
jgi:hypothetical protein